MVTMKCILLGTLIFMTLIMTETVEGATSDGNCEDGWVPFREKCYKFMRDEEATDVAFEICKNFGSILVSSSNEQERDFLASYVQTLDVYAWRTGVHYEPYDDRYYAADFKQFANLRYDILMPEMQIDPDDDLNCIAYRPFRGLTSVGCNIKLPYVCRGDPSNVTANNASNWVQSGTQDIFWVGEPTAKLNYSAAKESCESKGMALLSIRNREILHFIEDKLGLGYYKYIEPWWTGLQVLSSPNSSPTYRWTDGVPMDKSVIIWKSPLPFGFRLLLLLGSGKTTLSRSSSSVQLPSICMKNITYSLQYNCPSQWVRGGGSCYRFIPQPLPWDRASKVCSHSGSHLLTIDSKDEMTWLAVSNFVGSEAAYTPGFWTSLNDRKDENNFVWSDGSQLDTNIVDWVKPLEEDTGSGYRGLCITLKAGELIPSSCQYRYTFGCQYKPSAGTCHNSSWKYFKGYCYLTTFEGLRSSFFTSAKATCKRLLSGSDIVPSLVKIQTKDTFNFLKNAYVGKIVAIGLNSLSAPGVWTWDDGSQADLSVFPNMTEPNNGAGGAEQDCVVVSRGLKLFDLECDRNRFFICEKEIQVRKTPYYEGSVTGHAKHSKQSPGLVVVLVVLLWISV